MSSSPATVRSIHVDVNHFSLGGLSLQGDHVVPEGAKVLEMKQCENCTGTFLREKRPLEARKVNNRDGNFGNASMYKSTEPEFSVIYVDRGQRYCKRCVARFLLPENQDAYKEQLLPQLQQAHYGSKLPRYDESLLPRSVTPKPEVRQRRKKHYTHKDWKVRLMDAFMVNGAMTYEAMQEVVGNVGGPSDTATLLNHAAFKLQRVGSAPRRTLKGPQPGLFLPTAMAQEYFKTIASVGAVQ